MGFFCYELFALLRFVIVQDRLRLEELDVFKSKFNRQERRIETAAKRFSYFAFGLVGVMVAVFVGTRTAVELDVDNLCNQYSWVFQIMAFLQLIICLLTAGFLVGFYAYFYCKMKRIHALEFKRHLCKYTILATLFTLCLLCEAAVEVETFLLGSKFKWAATIFFQNLWQWVAFSAFVDMMPYLVFLTVSLVYLPHDCFRCFGKDPDRKFSIY